MKEKLTIGKLAQKSDVGVETVRFYERKGLITQPSKQGGFRHYPEDYISRIKFIKRSQELGFTLKEAAELLELKLDRNAKCSDVLLRTQAKIDEVNEKIADLKKMKKSLMQLAVCCEDTNVALSDCPILDHF